jgi:PAS domain S-box-containing protein
MSTDLPLVQLALLGEAVTAAEGVGVFVWDDDRRYVAVNEAGCALVGLTREELLSLRVGDLTEARAEPHFHDVQKPGVSTGTVRLTRRDGGTVELEFVTFHTKLAGLPYLASVCWRPED